MLDGMAKRKLRQRLVKGVLQDERESYNSTYSMTVIELSFKLTRCKSWKLKSYLMKITDRHSRLMKQQTQNMEIVESRSQYNVFLGGSCGGRKSPTTWRKEIAIPLLKENAVTFYNPQVDTWTQDLILKENEAKEKSDWLLFMLESSTRGIVSLVEVAYLVGSGRSVIFVLQQERVKGELCIKEDSVSELESDDIMDSQKTLSSIISKYDHCQYFSVLEDGLKHVISGLKENDTVQKNGNSFRGGNKGQELLQKLQKKLKLLPHIKAYDENGKRKRPMHLNVLNPIVKYSVGIITADSPNNLVQLTMERLSTSRTSLSPESIYVAQGTDVTDNLLQCHLILVVIPDNALACSAMCKAAYVLSKCKNIVMCVQDVDQDAVDNGNTHLTTTAVDDFNRARRYLRDMAATHCVPVYNSVDDALNCSAQRLKGRIPFTHPVITED